MNTTPATQVSICLCYPQDIRNVASCLRLVANYPITSLKVISRHTLDLPALDGLSSYATNHVNLMHYTTLSEALSEADFVIGTSRRMRQKSLLPQWSLPQITHHLQASKYGIRHLHILFGNERTGLLKEEMQWCQSLMSIPTHESFPSMNLSHAVACVLYELYRSFLPTIQASKSTQVSTNHDNRHGDHNEYGNEDHNTYSNEKGQGTITPNLITQPTLASTQVKEAFYKHVQRAACILDYPPHKDSTHYAQKISKLIEKAELTPQEYSALMGIFKEIYQQMSSQQKRKKS